MTNVNMRNVTIIGGCLAIAITLGYCARGAIGGGEASVMPPPWATGATNAAVTQDNIKSTVCVVDWTKTIRPKASVTDKLKVQQLKTFGYADQNTKDYEEDHLISLEIGGAPNDPHNLWPEPYAGPCSARIKDKIEDKLHRLVCDGTITLADAQDAIASNWVAAYNKYIGPLSCNDKE